MAQRRQGRDPSSQPASLGMVGRRRVLLTTVTGAILLVTGCSSTGTTSGSGAGAGYGYNEVTAPGRYGGSYAAL